MNSTSCRGENARVVAVSPNLERLTGEASSVVSPSPSSKRNEPSMNRKIHCEDGDTSYLQNQRLLFRKGPTTCGNRRPANSTRKSTMLAKTRESWDDSASMSSV